MNDGVLKKTQASAWEHLAGILVEHGVRHSQIHSRDEVFDILIALSVPPDLRGLCEVAANVIDMAELLNELADADSLEDVQLCVRVCAVIKACTKTLSRELPKTVMRSRKKKSKRINRLIKTYTKCPLYGCLWHRAGLPAYQIRFLLLQAYLLNYFLRFGHKAISSHPYIWAKAIRILSEKGATQKEILKHLPAKALTPRDYRSRLISARQELSANKRASENLDDLIRMFDVLVTGEEPLPRSRVGHSAFTSHVPRYVRGDMPGDYVEIESHAVELPGGGRTRISLSQPLFDKSGRRAHLSRTGLSPRDEIPSFDAVSHSRNLTDSGCYTIRDYILRMKDARRALARTCMHLVGRWESLNEHDLAVLGSAIKRSNGQPALLSVPSRVLAWLMLFTAREPKSFSTLRVVGTTAGEPALHAGPVYERERHLLWLAAGDHVPFRDLGERAKQFVRPVQSSLRLILPDPLVDAIGELTASRGCGGGAEWPVFQPGEVALGIREIKRFLAGLNRLHGTRLTIGRIRNCLHARIEQLPGGGHVEAGIITGRFAPYSQNPSYYTHVSEHRLQTLHWQTCLRLAEETACGLLRMPVGVAGGVVFSTTHGLGSMIVPTDQAVRESVQWMLKGIKHARGADLELRVMQLHNHLVAYTLAMLQYATGHRSTNDPFSQLGEVDLQNRLAVISDKDGGDYFGSHVVVLPRICCDQIHAYLAHLEALIDYLSVIDPGLAAKLKTAGRFRHRKRRVRDKETRAEAVPLFFWLEKQHPGRTKGGANGNDGTTMPKQGIYQIKPVTPSSLLEFLGPLGLLPTNSNRHCFCTRLHERDCPGDIVDAAMGHWLLGQEPWGRASCLSPRIYFDLLDKHLSAILRDDGWIVAKGLHGNH